ncbi:tyrosine-protein phosphatase [Bradyrhizobium diazoefficiens]|nr:tyrosine-protein phosphatase [Bradyrhizobium diazoefficiens]UCF55455.1 MAG: tyrosine-protein phosphatase [Bradyrhizobium sp.]MBR0962944.1 tyrosine-protein phosphatase [Bradyrhizobium diazoefficiens]MBR0977104.1 tyrosine-protein phosphatase [Bradyrhizobium diazoefficiens]MBR1005749.1 tyrosine-protein phosphatase [Bradyrhizobium diazoefficiens]MBR1012222.1 tyrosine-protein phosphatase [Bradyrhizobium diazoefficiens]
MQDSSPTGSPARHLALQGASNFRDLGGYPTADGRTTRWRHIFRSNHLGHLTPEDIDVVRALGVRSAFDFRGAEERTAGICVVDEIAVHSLPIEPTVVAALRAELAKGALTAPVALELMRDSYRNYVRHNTHSFRALFGHLLEDRAPLVIHCTAGKDRTGFASALILHALGVPDDVIAEDYLLTNRFYRRDATAATDLPEDVRSAIGSVETSYLAAAFEAVDKDYGDLETYLRDGLKIGPPEREALRARYLQS